MKARYAAAVGLLCFAACNTQQHELALEGRTFMMGTPALADLEGETLLLWMNVEDSCTAAIDNVYPTAEGEDLVILRYWGLPVAPGRLDGLSVSADVFFEDARVDPSVTYGSSDELDFIEVVPHSDDGRLLRFRLTFVAANEGEGGALRWLDSPVLFEGEQVAYFCY